MMKKLIPKFIGLYLNALAVVSPRKAGRAGFDLFCRPLRAPLKPHHRAFLEGAHAFELRHEGNRIQGYRWGNGPRRVLFLHGWQSHTYRWKKYIEQFSKKEFTLYAFDAPGHGQSGGKYINVPAYSAVIRHFISEVGPMELVVTHSLGGFSMLHALHHHPDLGVQGLVLLGTPGEANEFILYYQQVLGLNAHTMKHVRNYFMQRIQQPPEYFSSQRFAREMPIPGLIIHDREDKEAPYHHAVEVHAAWPKSKLITTEGLGHNLKSKEVVHHVLEFAQSYAEMEVTH